MKYTPSAILAADPVAVALDIRVVAKLDPDLILEREYVTSSCTIKFSPSENLFLEKSVSLEL